MAFTTELKKLGATLSENQQKLLIQIGQEMAGNSSVDTDEDDEPKPVARQKVKSGPGRPRKVTEADIELTSGRKGTKKLATKPTKVANTKAPAAAKVSANADFAEMDKKQRIAAAEKMGISLVKLLKGDANTVKVLTAINKLSLNENRSVEAVEKMAKKAGVDLTFGKGRPPGTDEGKKRRILVRMANEGEFGG